jgi:hypothetical protein
VSMTIPVDNPQKNWRVFVSSMCASMRHRGARESRRPRIWDERPVSRMSGCRAEYRSYFPASIAVTSALCAA